MAQKRSLNAADSADAESSASESEPMEATLPEPKLCPTRLRGVKRSLVEKVNEDDVYVKRESLTRFLFMLEKRMFWKDMMWKDLFKCFSTAFLMTWDMIQW